MPSAVWFIEKAAAYMPLFIAKKMMSLVGHIGLQKSRRVERLIKAMTLRFILIVGFCVVKLRFYRASKAIDFKVLVSTAGLMRGGEMWHFTADDIMTCVSDPKIIKWRTTSYSYEASLVSKQMFYHSKGISGFFNGALFSFVSSLKIFGYLDEALKLYQAMAAHQSNSLAVQGLIGLGDISHIISLWEKQTSNYEIMGITSFSLFGGFRKVLVEQMCWTAAQSASFENACSYYRAAVKRDPRLVIGWNQLGRLSADIGQHKRAAHYMYAARKRATSKNISTLFDLETARMRSLVALAAGRPIAELDQKIIEHFHEGKLQVVDKVEMHEGFDLVQDQQTVIIECDIYLSEKKTSVRKNLSIMHMSMMSGVNGLISAINGAPFLLNGSQIQHHATPFPFVVGRELFSPLYIGQTEKQEIYISKNFGSYENVIVLAGLSDNYFHFLFDILGTLAFIKREIWEKSRFLIFGESLKPFQKDLLRRIGIEDNRVDLAPRGNHFVSVRNATVTSYPASHTVAHPEVVRFLRAELLPVAKSIKQGKRVYFVRKKSRAFSLYDRGKIDALMKRYGFISYDPATMTIQEQIDAICDAEVIALDAGAAAANLIFASQNAKVIVMGTSVLAFYEAWGCLSNVLQLDLSYVMSQTRISPKYLLVWCDFKPKADIKTLEVCLREKCDDVRQAK